MILVLKLDTLLRGHRALLVYIWGNHEKRILRFLNENAPKFRKRILRDYVDMFERLAASCILETQIVFA